MSHTFAVDVADESELRSAFSLFFQQSPLEERHGAARGALELVAEGELERDNVLVVRGAEGVCGVAVFAANAGAAGQVWPPQVRAGHPREVIEDTLLGEAVRRLRAAGSKFVQALLTEEDLSAVPCLTRGGFTLLSSLFTLYHPLDESNVVSPSEPTLTYQPVGKVSAELFRGAMHRTYERTLDFPELNGIRTVDETIEAHRQHGTFHPEHWLLARCGDAVVGVLILVEMAERNEWELSYVGVVPEARCRGVGRALVREALCRAAQLRARQLTVAVDIRNAPAWNLYAGLGFQPLEEHQVYLLIPGG